MLPFGDAAFQTRIEGIATEECQAFGLAGEVGRVLVIVAEGLKARYTAHRVARTLLDMIDIVVMDKTQIRWASGGVGGVRDRL